MRENYFTVYLLESPETTRRTYVGYTNDTVKRLKQHNGELAGGARATRGNHKWRYRVRVKGFKERGQAMSFEWAVKHPRNIKGASRRSLTPAEKREIIMRTLFERELVRQPQLSFNKN